MSSLSSFARVLVLLIPLALAACGNKGDLVRPTPKNPNAPTPATPPTPLPDLNQQQH